jgi:hypothetical protein
MSGDRNVERRVCKHHAGPLASEKSGIGVGYHGICTKDVMVAEAPELSRLGPRHRGLIKRRNIVLFVLARGFEGNVDFAHFKPAKAKVDVFVDFQDVRKFEPQTLEVPTPPSATYTFKHALIRDAAYATLLRSRRQELHARIAKVLEDRVIGGHLLVYLRTYH